MPVEGNVLDAEEEQAGFVRRPRDGGPPEEQWTPTSLTLSSRPLPDVMFGAPKPVAPASREPVEAPGGAVGAGEITGPQPVVDAAFTERPVAVSEDGGAHRRRAALLAAVVLAGALVVALVAVVVWPSGSDGRVRQTASAPAAAQPGEGPGNGPDAPRQVGPEDGAEPDPGTGDPAKPADSTDPGSRAGQGSPAGPGSPADAVDPAGPDPGAVGSGPVLSGRTPQGIEVTYRTVETAEGYFEGEVRFVNATGAPLPAWTLSFTYPGAVIRNVWGGDFRTREDGTVVVTGNGDSTPVAAGAWVSVRFGGSGTPSRPQGCTVNGAACGF